MFCTRCGAQNPEGTRFCTNCGAALDEVRPPIQPPVQPPVQPACQPPVTYGQPVFVPEQEHPVVAEVKRFACSPLFLAAVILFSLSILFSVIAQFTAGDEIAALITRGWEWSENVFGELDVEGLGNLGEFMDSVDFKSSLQSGQAFSLPVFEILTAVGLWLIFAAGRKRTTPGISPTGLKLVKTVTTISFVLSMVGLALGTLSLIAVAVVFGVKGREIPWPSELLRIFSASSDDLYRILLVIFIVLAAAMLISLIFTALYYGKLIKSMGTALNTAATGVPSDRISVFAAILTILSGVSALSGITSLVEYLPDPMMILSSLAGGVASILFGVVMLKYRTRMRELMMGIPMQ